MITIVRLIDGAKLDEGCRVAGICEQSVTFVISGHSRLNLPHNLTSYRHITFDGKTATVEFVRDGMVINAHVLNAAAFHAGVALSS
jgi:hypothetical protein